MTSLLHSTTAGSDVPTCEDVYAGSFYRTETKVQSTLKTLHVASRHQKTANFVCKVLKNVSTKYGIWLKERGAGETEHFYSYRQYEMKDRTVPFYTVSDAASDPDLRQHETW